MLKVVAGKKELEQQIQGRSKEQTLEWKEQKVLTVKCVAPIVSAWWDIRRTEQQGAKSYNSTKAMILCFMILYNVYSFERLKI